jgi:CRISPR-associated protein Csb2
VLRLDIQLLTGAFRAASVAARDAPEWPPHPDRVFSALVCAWAEQGRDPEGGAALRWLEALRPPLLHASDARPRDVAPVFVPANDVATLPERRTRRERFFPAMVPDDPVVRFWWEAADPDMARHLGALDRIAQAVGHLGHSSSLVAMRFLRDHATPQPRYVPGAPAAVRLRLPWPGRLDELLAGYEAGRKRGWRPEPGPATAYRDLQETPTDPAVSPFGRRWIVLCGRDAASPALEAFVPVAEAMRGAVLAHADEPVSPVLSGHGAEGAAHLAILPLANAGFAHSDGRLFGLALVLPAEHDGLADPVRLALERAVGRFLAAGGELRLGRFGTFRLEHEPATERASLRPGRYLRTARRFATVTPLVLPRHMKKGRDDPASQIALACRQQGLPEPAEIEAGPHPYLPGTSFAQRRAKEDRAGRGWIVRAAFGTRSLVHARIRFDGPVRGPLLLGAGRHFGLGLMLPVEEA